MWQTIILSLMFCTAFILGFALGRSVGYHSALDYWRRIYRQARLLERQDR